ncbi:MAG: MBL fold metallo-hydrolase [Verrucomicrobia bacterium]|nr:MAG: MBL fold metallo-hydrolase [Verrucomicrobiota bacterium]
MKKRLILGVMFVAMLNGVLAGSDKDGTKVYLYEVDVGSGGNAFMENMYLVVRKDDMSAIIIDPGNTSEKMERFIARKEIQVRAVLNTHGHFDHIGANSHYAKLYNVPVWCSAADKGMFVNENKKNMPTDFFDEDQTLTLDEFEVKVITTPGHSPGSACFLIGGNLFSGDTLFKEGIGRTFGNEVQKRESRKQEIGNIKRKLLILPRDTEVYPGHGEDTRIKYEARDNPHLQRD